MITKIKSPKKEKKIQLNSSVVIVIQSLKFISFVYFTFCAKGINTTIENCMIETLTISYVPTIVNYKNKISQIQLQAQPPLIVASSANTTLLQIKVNLIYNYKRCVCVCVCLSVFYFSFPSFTFLFIYFTRFGEKKDWMNGPVGGG
jgi:hypothetical protein